MRAARIDCPRRRPVRWRELGLRFLALAGLHIVLCAPSGGQEGIPGGLEQHGRIVVPRVAILSIPEPQADNARVKRIIAVERATVARRRRGRRRGRPAAEQPSTGSRPAGGSAPTKSASLDAGVTPEQLRAVAGTLFVDATSDRIQDALGAVIVPNTEVGAAMSALHLSMAEAAAPAGAAALCRSLRVDALVVCRLTRVDVRQAVSRDVSVWFKVAAPFANVSYAPSRGGRGGESRAVFAPPTSFSVAGAASCGRAFLRPTYNKSVLVLVREATQRAAAEAARTLRTGKVAPLARDGDRIAIAPVLSPATADALLFRASGRRTLAAAVNDLPRDVSDRFTPDLLPLAPAAIIDARAVRQLLLRTGAEPETLWREHERPDTARVCAVGRRLRVDYVLMARVTDIEIEEGPLEIVPSITSIDPTEVRTGAGPDAAPMVATNEETECGARAEVTGALVRVADGVVLWDSRTTATMTARPPRRGAAFTRDSERRVAVDAVRFALLHLQRELASYRAGFDR